MILFMLDRVVLSTIKIFTEEKGCTNIYSLSGVPIMLFKFLSKEYIFWQYSWAVVSFTLT